MRVEQGDEGYFTVFCTVSESSLPPKRTLIRVIMVTPLLELLGLMRVAIVLEVLGVDDLLNV